MTIDEFLKCKCEKRIVTSSFIFDSKKFSRGSIFFVFGKTSNYEKYKAIVTIWPHGGFNSDLGSLKNYIKSEQLDDDNRKIFWNIRVEPLFENTIKCENKKLKIKDLLTEE